MAKVLPDAGKHVTATLPSTMSVAVALNVTALPVGPVASVVMLAGNVKVGLVVSCTVTVNEPVLVLLWASVAEQLTVVVAIANVLPDAGEHVTATLPSTMSVALA